MSLGEHLRELRSRIVRVVLGLALGAVVGWFVYPHLFAVLQRPVLDVAAERGEVAALNFGGVATSFDMQLKVSLFCAVVLSSPWWIYQLWAFITPGLTRRERVVALGFLGAAVPLFLAGIGLAWWLLPQAVTVLTGFTPQGAYNLIDAQTYLSFVMRMTLAFGLAFLLPVLMVALNLAGVVRARTWWAGWRWAALLAFLFGAVATPTGDAVSMLTLAVPICILYFGAAGLCSLHDRRVARRATVRST